MNTILRRATANDAATCAAICHSAFKSISERHNFPPDFPTVEPAEQLMAMLLSRDDIYAVAAEKGSASISSSAARAWPITRGRSRLDPASGERPRLTKGIEKRAPSPA